MFEAKDEGYAGKPCFLFQNPELRIGQPICIPMLLRGGRYGLRGPVLVFGIDDDIGSTVVEGLHHLAFVERHPVSGRAGEAVAADGIRAFLFFKLLARTEQAGVVGHVEHRRILHRPRLHFLAR